MTYFQRYPSLITRSLINPTTNVEMPDIFRRLRISKKILENKNNYTEYYNSSILRPEQISYKVYGDTNFFWVILLMNNIINVNDEWPLTDEELEEYISKKYTNADQIAHYETKEIRNTNNQILLKGNIVVPENYTFMDSQNVYSGNSVRVARTIKELELEKNEQKKTLKILKKRLIPIIESEFDRLIKYQSKNNLDAFGRKY